MDWSCATCSFKNHSYRSNCLKCNNQQQQSNKKNNDWTCEKCNEL